MIAGRGDRHGQPRPSRLNAEARYYRAAELVSCRTQVPSLPPAPA
jgi:hypothetical protein